MDGSRRGQRPGLEDISGSKNWEDMVDQGFVVHRLQIFDGASRKTSDVVSLKGVDLMNSVFRTNTGNHYLLGSGKYVSSDCAET